LGFSIFPLFACLIMDAILGHFFGCAPILGRDDQLAQLDGRAQAMRQLFDGHLLDPFRLARIFMARFCLLLPTG
jgi:hypothetical protein